MSEHNNLIQGEDFEITSEGNVEMTSHYLKKRGHCCKSACSQCPYEFTRNSYVDPNIPQEFSDPWSMSPNEQIEIPFDDLD